MKRKIYIAGSWSNAEEVKAMDLILRGAGHEVFNFTDGSSHYALNMQEFTDGGGEPKKMDQFDVMTFAPAMQVFESDKAGLDWADTVLLLLPSGRSAHLEAGYKVGQGGDLFIVGDFPAGEWDVMYQWANEIYRKNEMTRLLKDLKK
jgi:nucleoside 2-deoxyribosyltransferase